MQNSSRVDNSTNEVVEIVKICAETGTPIWKIARSSTRLAVWLPEPFTVATWMLKSLTMGSMDTDGAGRSSTATSDTGMQGPQGDAVLGRWADCVWCPLTEQVENALVYHFLLGFLVRRGESTSPFWMSSVICLTARALDKQETESTSRGIRRDGSHDSRPDV